MVAWQQSDALRSQSKVKQSRIVPTHQIFSHTTTARSNRLGSGHGEGSTKGQMLCCGFMLLSGVLMLNCIHFGSNQELGIYLKA